jgi:hypothetical protein
MTNPTTSEKLSSAVRRFRKKPVVIEAIQFTDESKDRCGCFVTCNWAAVFKDGKPAIEIQTLEGTMTAVIGDWIIKGVKGEFYPCKPDIFEATYEPAEAPTQ